MSKKEITVAHSEIKDPQTITDVNKRLFAENGLDFHKHEVVSFEDDNDKGVRVMKVRNSKLFFMGDVPWLKKKESD